MGCRWMKKVGVGMGVVIGGRCKQTDRQAERKRGGVERDKTDRQTDRGTIRLGTRYCKNCVEVWRVRGGGGGCIF